MAIKKTRLQSKYGCSGRRREFSLSHNVGCWCIFRKTCFSEICAARNLEVGWYIYFIWWYRFTFRTTFRQPWGPCFFPIRLSSILPSFWVATFPVASCESRVAWCCLRTSIWLALSPPSPWTTSSVRKLCSRASLGSRPRQKPAIYVQWTHVFSSSIYEVIDYFPPGIWDMLTVNAFLWVVLHLKVCKCVNMLFRAFAIHIHGQR